MGCYELARHFVSVICLLLALTISLLGFIARQQSPWLPIAAGIADFGIVLGGIKTVMELIKMTVDIKKEAQISVATYEQILAYARKHGRLASLFVVLCCTGMAGTVLYVVHLSDSVEAKLAQRRVDIEKLENQNATLRRSETELKHQVERLKTQDVPKDAIQAVSWLNKADAGDVSAMYNLGTLYATGRGVPRDDTQAIRWFRKAAALGDEKAKEQLKLLKVEP